MSTDMDSSEVPPTPNEFDDDEWKQILECFELGLNLYLIQGGGMDQSRPF